MNEIKPEFASAILDAQMKMTGPAKDSNNPHFHAKYSSLASVRESVIPAFHAAGIAVIQEMVTEIRDSRSHLGCTTWLIHQSGERISFGPVYSPLAKEDPQGIGSATTYLRRYTLLSVAGLAPEDDDGNHASYTPQQASQQQPRASQPQQASGGGKDPDVYCMFGTKHKGQKWSEVPDGYVRYCVENMREGTAAYAAVAKQYDQRNLDESPAGEGYVE